MIITILSFIAVLIAVYHTYKTAKDNDRNAVGWALVTFVVGFGLQIIFPVVILIFIAVAMRLSGKILRDVDELPWSLGTIIYLIGIAASFIGMWTILRRVSAIPDDEISSAPPSPPSFN